MNPVIYEINNLLQQNSLQGKAISSLQQDILRINDTTQSLTNLTTKLTSTVEILMNIVETQKTEIQQMKYEVAQLKKEMHRVSGFTLNS